MNGEKALTEDNDLSKREKRKALRRNKLRNRLFKEEDIKYQGPLSYRAIRIIAWIAFALGQIAIVNSLAVTLMQWDPLGEGLQTTFSIMSSIATPLFIVASFGLVLNKKRGFRNFIILYGAAFLGIGIGICFFYYRYVNGLLVEIGIDQTKISDVINNFIFDRVNLNVFADLFAFALFNYFVNYEPKKLFPGKSIYVFRCFAILPILFILASYILNVLAGLSIVTLPFFIYPFMATKSPIIFAVFLVASLWIKNRERLFVKLGATKKEYQAFLLTNRNSLSFSTSLVMIIVFAAVLDILFGIIIAVLHYLIGGNEMEQIMGTVFASYKVGQSIPLLLTIPILFLYSYTRDHKNSMIDIALPVAGIGLTILIYIEAIYQFIIKTING